MGRGSTDDTYTWNEYGRPAIETMYAVGAEVQAGQVDAIYHGGDISYATGYAAVWDFFLDELSICASGIVPDMSATRTYTALSSLYRLCSSSLDSYRVLKKVW